MSERRILVTGAAGYIGCHTVLALLEAGFQVLGVDSFVTSTPKAVAATRALAKHLYDRSFDFIRSDLRDVSGIAATLRRLPCDAVIHFAALKAVDESVRQPLDYYENNVAGLLALLRVLQGAGVFRFVFSSSATVYGNPASLPVAETAPCAPTNPYGRTKHMVEQILNDMVASDRRWRVGILRYFNPVGAHESGQIGEDPAGLPNNLMPMIARVASGESEYLTVYGKDWPTPDGTGVRDYLHVMDLAEAHVAAVRRLMERSDTFTVNLGTGGAISVLEMVRAFEEASGRQISFRVAPRRAGDVAACYADPQLANRTLGWQAHRDLARMCADTWRWQQTKAQAKADKSATKTRSPTSSPAGD